jgi:hypothetical protein
MRRDEFAVYLQKLLKIPCDALQHGPRTERNTHHGYLVTDWVAITVYESVVLRNSWWVLAKGPRRPRSTRVVFREFGDSTPAQQLHGDFASYFLISQPRLTPLCPSNGIGATSLQFGKMMVNRKVRKRGGLVLLPLLWHQNPLFLLLLII